MRINSKLKASVMAVALATVPLFSHAAGMGRLNVLSGLGQPFRAEIDLVAVQPSETDSLRASLASVDAFREAQIEYPSSSLGLRFDLQKRANGQYFIAVNSAQSINEPFLDFLVELKWEGGRVLREYTALLDPIGYAPTRPVAAAAKPVAPTSPVLASKPTVPTPTKPTPQTVTPVTATAGGDTYTVKPGDTLAKIAKDHMVDGVSLEQMLVALYQANQDAFDGNNMNRLKRGRILQLPTKDSVSAVDRHTANKEIHAQAEDWRAYRSKVAESATASHAAPETSAGTGKISTKVEDKSVAKAESAKDKLTLSKGDESGKLKERVHSLEEDTAAKQKALTDANEHIAQLEQANKKLEELLAVKSKQGADIQKEAAAKNKPAATPAATAAPAATPAPAPAAQKPAATPVATPAATPAPKPEAAKAPAATATPAPAAANESQPAKPAETPKPKPRKQAPLPPPEPEPSLLDDWPMLAGGVAAVLALAGGAFWFVRKRRKSSFEDSIITGSDLKSNTMVGNTGGAVISTGVTENSFLTDFSRAGLGTIDTDEVDPIAEAEVYMAYGRDAQAEEILRDALVRDGSRQEVRLKLLEIYSARKNMAAFESTAQELYAATQGNGPVWAQAAAMGKALDPQNPLYQQREPVDTGALDKTMVMSAGTLGDLTDTAKLHAPVVETKESRAEEVEAAGMGADLDFQLDAAQASATPETPSSLDFDLGFDAVPATEAGAAEVAHAAAATDLDVGSFEQHMDVQTPAAEPHVPASELDFDLGDFSLGETPVDAALPEAQGVGEILSLDIPLDMAGEAPAEPKAPVHAPAEAMAHEAAQVEAHEASFELPPMDSDFDLDLGTPAPAPAETSRAGMAELETPDLAGGLDFGFDLNEGHKPAETHAAPEFDIGDVSLDLDVAPGPAGPGEVMDFGVEMDDPVTTKIDLARAYIDMGDKEGAREILQEAASEGNADQKASAESLLAQL